MSGIFGFWNLDGRPADPAVLAAMSRALAHRGPDGWDSWSTESVGMGHRMLRTTPEAAYEQQPLVASNPVQVLSADLRLDNREELICDLEGRGRLASEIPDADLFLGSYRKRGERVAERLLGDFACALWDASRRELLCVRDHFGVKPLFYYHAPGRIFAFASEIKALLLLDGVSDDVNDEEVARHLLLPVGEDLGSTYYRAIRRVLPGHVLTVTQDGIAEKPYWALDATHSLVLSSDREYAEAVRETFLEAVQCRMRSSAPVASMLSGGIDSSSITSAAGFILQQAGSTDPLRTYSAVYPSVPESDEREYIDTVLEAFTLRPSFFAADRVSPIDEIHRMNWYGDGANAGGNFYLNWNLYQAAAGAGSRVILDGYDGDSTISHGFGRLNELANGGRWWTLTREVRALAQNLGDPWIPAVRSWIMPYFVKPALRWVIPRRARRRKVAAEGGTPQWGKGLNPAFQTAIAERVVPAEPSPRTERENHYRAMTRQILLDTLHWVDTAGAAAGMEARFPFFDVRLVELCLSLPPEQKLRNGWSRFILREAMAGILPDEIRWRPAKSSIAPGFHYALKAHASEQMASALATAEPLLSQYVDMDYVRALQRNFVAGTASPDAELQYWKIASLALWLTRSHGACPARMRRGTDFIRAPDRSRCGHHPPGGVYVRA
jgi:asparagine synthase (glutamine-hydrolysing)